MPDDHARGVVVGSIPDDATSMVPLCDVIALAQRLAAAMLAEQMDRLAEEVWEAAVAATRAELLG